MLNLAIMIAAGFIGVNFVDICRYVYLKVAA